MTDREKAIEILQRIADGKAEELNIFDDEGGGVCGQILEEQDAILAGIEALKEQRPHGEWISLANDNRPLDPRMKCSLCEEIHTSCASWNFCPNCGARMQKEVF